MHTWRSSMSAAAIVALAIMCASVRIATTTAATAVKCFNYTDTYVYQEYPTDPKKKKLKVCQADASGCFEYAGVRSGNGAMIYGSGCGKTCPKGSNLTCSLCATSLCNNATLASIKKDNRVCFTGLRPNSAMSENRRRKVWCATGMNQCFLITWISNSKKVTKYIGGCGKQQCNKKMNCTYHFCHENLCNGPPGIKKKPCPKIGCRGTGLTAHGPAALLFLTSLTALTAAAVAELAAFS